jgi:hypothetical protein
VLGVLGQRYRNLKSGGEIVGVFGGSFSEGFNGDGYEEGGGFFVGEAEGIGHVDGQGQGFFIVFEVGAQG